MYLSIIIPVLNEASQLGCLLQTLQPLRQQGCELVVVDGGSQDQSVAIARKSADQVRVAGRGRAIQMNAGASIANGDVLLFLHADTRLPDSAVEQIKLVYCQRSATGFFWGRFDVRLSGSQMVFRVIEKLINLRSRLTSIATGDQAIFISTALFHQAGGYPEIELMEDIALCKQLRQFRPPVCLSQAVQTSSRRWEQQGVIKTVWLMWKLRLLFFIGVSPARLVKMYYS